MYLVESKILSTWLHSFPVSGQRLTDVQTELSRLQEDPRRVGLI